jgi:hypothetical protein
LQYANDVKRGFSNRVFNPMIYALANVKILHALPRDLAGHKVTFQTTNPWHNHSCTIGTGELNF